MAVFSLTSDDEFIMRVNAKENSDIVVLTPSHDEGDSRVSWKILGYVGPSSFSKFHALEVFGVTIKGNKFKELLKDLKFDDANAKLQVNRLGQCFLVGISHPTFLETVRLNDMFCWSKYGVEVPHGALSHANVWDKRDMYNDTMIVDVPKGMRAVEEEKVLRRLLEEKEKESPVWKKELECTKEVVVRSEKNEILWKALLESKEKELEMVKNRLVSFKDVLIKTLVDDQHTEELIKKLDTDHQSAM
ncbi:hypothetical protein LINPERPRIM_LOCUS15885 [Linum perenne]